MKTSSSYGEHGLVGMSPIQEGLMRVNVSLFVLGWTLLLGAPTVRAKEPFVQHYEAAIEHFKSGRFSEAVAAYESAYRIKQLPRLRLMIARAHLHLGQSAEAARHLEWFLLSSPSDMDREEAKRLLSTCHARLMPLRPADEPSLATSPSGRSRATPVDPPPSAGPSEPPAAGGAGEAAGAEAPAAADGKAASGSSAHAESQPGSAQPAATAPAALPGRRTSPWLWTGIVSTGVLLVTTGVTGSLAAVEKDSLNRLAYELNAEPEVLAAKERVHGLTIAAATTGVVAAAVMTATLVYSIRRQRAPRLALVPEIASGRLGVAAGAGF
jgi:hypothetical protein